MPFQSTISVATSILQANNRKNRRSFTEQDVIRVGNNCDRSEMIRRGRDVERAVLSRGLLYHLEDRVIVHNNKTIVFS